MNKVLKYMLITLVTIGLIVISINSYVKISTRKQILNEKEYPKIADVDCIVVLGAAIWGDKPSPMLEDRLLEGINLYKKNVSNKILMSGDHGRKGYDEVSIMKKFAIEKGVPSEDIFMDHAGFSTYESIYRAKEIFQAKKIIIVTQEYHLHRALYIAQNTNMKAIGVSATKRRYFGQSKRNVREFAARIKDFFKCMFNKESAYLGEVIPINSDGDKTND